MHTLQIFSSRVSVQGFWGDKRIYSSSMMMPTENQLAYTYSGIASKPSSVKAAHSEVIQLKEIFKLPKAQFCGTPTAVCSSVPTKRGPSRAPTIDGMEYQMSPPLFFLEKPHSFMIFQSALQASHWSICLRETSHKSIC